MAFESLLDKLQNIFKNLRGKGRPSETDVKTTLKKVKVALLGANVSSKVVEQFINSVQERAIGQDVLDSLTSGQMVIKIAHEELINLMGSETTEIALRSSNEITVIMMAGLQEADRTTTTTKVTGKLKVEGRKPLLAACDVCRPVAIQQLQTNDGKQGVVVFSMGDGQKPVSIAKAAIEHMGKNGYNMVILDTANRLHIDEDTMDGLIEIKEAITVSQTLLIMDAITGQDAVSVAEMFNSKIGADDVILIKLDGDTRGGAALSVRVVTGRPILYIGMDEKLPNLERFYPGHMASRILGIGDILSLIEEAELGVNEQKAKELSQKLEKVESDYSDFLDQMRQIKKMGGMSSIMNMMPGMPQTKGNPETDESVMDRMEAIILSMTAQGRANPAILNPSRKQRIVRGAGVGISEVSRIVKQFDQMRRMMKQLPGMMGGKGGGDLGGMLGKFRMPFWAQRC